MTDTPPSRSPIKDATLKAIGTINLFIRAMGEAVTNLYNGADVQSFDGELERAKVYTGIGSAADAGLASLESSVQSHPEDNVATRAAAITAGADISEAKFEQALLRGVDRLIERNGSYSAAASKIQLLTAAAFQAFRKILVFVDKDDIGVFKQAVADGVDIGEAYQQDLASPVRDASAYRLTAVIPISAGFYSVENLSDGSHIITGLIPHTFIGTLYNDQIVPQGNGNILTISRGCGYEEVSNFIVGSRHGDLLDLSAFSNLKTARSVLRRSYNTDAGVTIALAPNAEVTLDGVTKADLRATPHTFDFGDNHYGFLPSSK